MTKIYALYRGDEYLMSGTVADIAAKRGVKAEEAGGQEKMTVAELIDELQQLHQEWHVTVDGFEVAGA